jgi:hypothetical protein
LFGFKQPGSGSKLVLHCTSLALTGGDKCTYKIKKIAAVHCKKKWRIINPHFAFMTVKSVYEVDLPFHKPFFLEKVGKRL